MIPKAFLTKFRGRKMNKAYVFIGILLVFIYVLISDDDEEVNITRGQDCSSQAGKSEEKEKTLIKMVATPCDKVHLDETFLMLKSAIMMNRGQYPIRQYILTDKIWHEESRKTFESWPEWSRSGVELILRHFEAEHLPQEAKDMITFGPPCTSVRLAMPELLPEEDALIYIDADFLFMTPPINLWDYFSRFSDVQLAGMTPINVEGGKSVVFKANQPYYPPLGAQAGFTLMNLTRMRAASWTKLYLDIYTQHTSEIFPFDQGIVNWAFHYHPEKLYLVSCEWNIRWFHCDKKLYCQEAINGGSKMVHGHTDAFYDPRRPVFNLVYQKYRDYNLYTDSIKDLRDRIHEGLMILQRDSKPCSQRPEMFTKQLDIMLEKDL